MDARDLRIVVETERHRVSGTLRVPSEGYRSRLTDYLNGAEHGFVALTDVEITALFEAPGRPVERRPFLALSLRHIVLAMPEDAAADVVAAGRE